MNFLYDHPRLKGLFNENFHFSYQGIYNSYTQDTFMEGIIAKLHR